MAALCVASDAQAQLYRCQQGAAVTFSDKPCAGGEHQLPVPRAPASPQADLQFDVLTTHYVVEGRNTREAYLWMRTNNPGGFAGWARWRVQYDFDTLPRPAGCSIDRLRLKVVGEIRMPRWAQHDAATPQDQAWWKFMYTSLKTHEDGHVQHGREFAVLLRQRLLGLGTLPCAEIQQRAQAEYARLYANLQQRDADYDRRTDHGLRQDNPR